MSKSEPTTPKGSELDKLPQVAFRPVSKSEELLDTVSQIGSYRVGEKVGQGAFGTVYKVSLLFVIAAQEFDCFVCQALDGETGDFVAIKRIRVDRIKNKQLMKLLAEGHLMEQLDHENIVKFHGALETDNHISLIMEFVDSGSLASVVSKYGNLSEKLAAVYLKQVLDGLAYLHRNNVVHRDSHNLLITNSGVVKLADFGIAHLQGAEDAGSKGSSIRKNNHAMDIGSPYWMAPEVIRLEEATPASDVWSIGCTAIELLTGKPPYFELSKNAACFRMVEDPHPPLPANASEELRSFLMRCFEKEPSQRATASELSQHEWISKNVSSSKKATMKKHTSITNLPRFQVNAAESKKAAQQAAMVKKSISVTTLPRYAVNPTLAGSNGAEFQSLRGRPSGLDEEFKKMEEEMSPSMGEKPPPPVQTSSAKGSLRGVRSSGRESANGSARESGSAKGPKSCHKCESKLGFIGGRVTCDGCKFVFCKNCASKKFAHPKFGKSCRLCPDCQTTHGGPKSE